MELIRKIESVLHIKYVGDCRCSATKFISDNMYEFKQACDIVYAGFDDRDYWDFERHIEEF